MMGRHSVVESVSSEEQRINKHPQMVCSLQKRLLLFLLTWMIHCDTRIAAFTAPGNRPMRIPLTTEDRIRQVSHLSPLIYDRPLHGRISLNMDAASNSESSSSSSSNGNDSNVDSTSEKELTRLQRWKRLLFPPKPKDGLSFRQRLAKMGLSVVLSYGWVSNVSYSITVSLAWYIFNKRTGLSPLAPGQWKPFLAVYAGFWVFNNIIRPVRLALSIGVSAFFDTVVNSVQEKFRVNKSVAVALTVFLANVVGTISLMCLGISLASLASGVPVFVTK